MTTSEARLLERLYNRYVVKLAGEAYRRLGDLELARDMAQEVFLAACSNAEALCAAPNQAPAWLFRTLQTLLEDERRRRRLLPSMPLEELPEEAQPTDGGGLDQDLRAVLPADLRPADREILLLRLEDRLLFRTISRLLAVNQEACRQRFSRAANRCRKLYLEELVDCGS